MPDTDSYAFLTPKHNSQREDDRGTLTLNSIMNTFMQKLGVLALMLSAFLATYAYDFFAYDFEVDGICYNITDPTARTVEVTSAFPQYSGDISLPASVTYNDEQYAVTAIGNNAFSNCFDLTSITIPGSVTTIGDDAFTNCFGLTSITIPGSVTTIGDFVFTNCFGLTSITIPSSVTTIGRAVFEYCKALENINVEAENSVYSSVGGVLYDKTGTTLICFPCGRTGEAVIPQGVITIGAGAFLACANITSVTIPNTVTTIGDFVFVECSGLTSVVIPNSVTTIGDGAFSYCIGLTSITIPNSVTTIGKSAFFSCVALGSISVEAENPAYSSVGGVLYNKTGTTMICFPAAKTGEAIVPEGVTAIDHYAFGYCAGLTSISLPNTLTTIGGGAFCWCAGLTSLTIPNTVTTIGESAFSGCRGLTSITLPNTITTIGQLVFSYCSALTSITIPNTVTTIGNEAFVSCESLSSITIPNSVTTIGEIAFGYCSGLTSITIGHSVTNIGAGAFSGCSALTSVKTLAVTPPVCGEMIFELQTTRDGILYVPAGSAEAYRQAEVWKEFANIEDAGAGIEAVEAATDGATEVFNLSGAKVADSTESLPAGIYLVRTGSTVSKLHVR